MGKWKFLVYLCMACFIGNIAAYAQAEDSDLIWQIGQKDHDFSEFALAGTGGSDQFLKQFGQGVTFTIGKDIPSKAWPYIHPANTDPWAGHRKHPFTIRFDLGEKQYDMYSLNICLTSAHANNPPKIHIKANDVKRTIQAKRGPGDHVLTNPKAGGQQSYTLYFRGDVFKKGQNTITITTEGSWMLYDAVTFEAMPDPDHFDGIEVSAKPFVYRHQGKAARKLTLKFQGGVLMSPATVHANIAGSKTTQDLDPQEEFLGSTDVLVAISDPEQTQTGELTLKTKNQTLTVPVTIEPYRSWEVHLIHQTHLDIGYTHTQEEVLDLQVHQLKESMDLVDASQNRDPDAHFRWHPEGMWAVEEFMRTASTEEKERFVNQTRSRDIHLDVLYAQAMTGICSEEELYELMGSAKRYAKQHNVTIDSAMQSDVPGYTWGLVPALAQNGVKYLSVGPNSGHRVGRTFYWADQPFYWESPSGQERVLFWMCGRGYSMFQRSGVGRYDGLSDCQLIKYIDDVDHYLKDLEVQGYPYELFMLRYSIGSDNGPPDPTLSEAIERWNQEHLSPRIILSSNSKFFTRFEKLYGDQLPVYRGDFTPYWEDGAASTSADTGISRRAAEQLVQAQTLWTLLEPDEFPHEQFDSAWTDLIMYDEHTWGAHNSIGDPDSEFAVRQAAYKQKYALDGASQTKDLFVKATRNHQKKSSSVIDVYNTLNWKRSEIVLLNADQSKAGDRVEDSNGRAVASQRLKSGELAFLAIDIPPLGARRFTVKKGKAVSKDDGVQVTKNTLEHSSIQVVINPDTGAVMSLKQKAIGKELVDSSKGYQVNDYLYILERDPSKNNMRIEDPVKISVVDRGPLVGTLKIESPAPGAQKLVRTVRIFHGSDLVEIENVVDKLKERRPEGVYFNFPFNIPDGIMKIDTPWAVYEPEKEQLPGANRNFFCTQRFVDISNGEYGVTWMSIDAPIVQWDPICIDHYRANIVPNQTIHSWVMNNHWETNYKADQEGLIPFKYALWPHKGSFDNKQSQRISRSVHQPLVAVLADPVIPVVEQKLQVQGDGIVVTSMKSCRDGNGYMVRLFNTDQAKSTASLKFRKCSGSIWKSNPMEEKIRKVNATLEMAPQEIVTLRISE